MREPFNEWVQQAKAVPIQKEIERRGIKLRRSGAELVGPCPRCGGEDRFAVNTKKQVWNCRGCGSKGSVIDLVMALDAVDLNTACTTLTGKPPPKKTNGKDASNHGAVPKTVEVFEYTDESGAVLSVIKRIEFEKPDGTYVLEKDGKRKKVFPQYRPDPNKPSRLLKGVEGVRVVPYRLHDLGEALANGRTVFIVEGEAKVNLLWSWNLAATCSVGGSGKWKPEHSEFLRGADVVLLPDHDNAGWEHVSKVGAALTGVAARVRVLVLPHVKAKDDIIDWAKAGATREQFDVLLEKAQDWKPISVEENEEKVEAKKREDELIDALMNTPKGIEYHRKHAEAVKELKISKTALNEELQTRRDTIPMFGHWNVVPWNEPAEGDSLLRDIIRCIRRYEACSHDVSLTGALWTMFSWIHDEVAIHSPILLVTSAEHGCGKSTMLGVLSFLIQRGMLTVDISKAALYRSIQLWSPSFLIDEFDQVLASASKDENQGELRSVINSGHTRGQTVIRCITDDHRPERFSTFAPKVIGMIGHKMPVATFSRCIPLEMRRRTKADNIERFKHQDDAELSDLRRRLRRWSMDNVDGLRDVVVPMPKGFINRLDDNWRLPFAIADLCSGAEDWGDKAREAAVNIEAVSDKTSISIKLLIDIKRIFDQYKWDAVLSATLVSHLKEDPEAPWAEWNRGKGLTPNSLAKLLDQFGIKSGDVHLPGDIHGKGYKRSQFEPEWAAYLPDDVPLSPDSGF
jgi:hypothetical protein